MNFIDNYPEIAEQTAEKYFKNDRLNCAESALQALLVSCGEECPLEILKLAGGFGGGIGRSGCACGALLGSVMAASTLFGRTKASGAVPGDTVTLAKKLHDAFREHHQATCCRILHKGLSFGTKEQIEACSKRTGETVKIAARIIMEHGNSQDLQEKSKPLA